MSYSFYNSLGKIWCYFFMQCVAFFTEMNVSLLQEMDSLTLPLSTSYLHFVCDTLNTLKIAMLFHGNRYHRWCSRTHKPKR